MPLDAADLAAFVDPDLPSYAQAVFDGRLIDGSLRVATDVDFGQIVRDAYVFRARSIDVDGLRTRDRLRIAGIDYRVTAVRHRDGLAFVDIAP
jgi:hypothetical protein